MKAIEFFFNETLPYPTGVNSTAEVVASATAGELYGDRAGAVIQDDGTCLHSSVRAGDGLQPETIDERRAVQRKVDEAVCEANRIAASVLGFQGADTCDDTAIVDALAATVDGKVALEAYSLGGCGFDHNPHFVYRVQPVELYEASSVYLKGYREASVLGRGGYYRLIVNK